MPGAADHRPDELLDVVTPTGRPLGRQPRSVVHHEGLWHQTFHCLVVRSGQPATILLQRRHPSSRAFGGMLDLTVTGHLVAGERPDDGAREIREELGIDVDPDRLVSLGRRLLADDRGEGANREVTHVHLLTDDTSLDDLRPDPAQVAGFVELPLAGLLRMLVDPEVPVEARQAIPGGPVPAPPSVRDVTCRGVELVPGADSYWVVLAVMAERHAAGLQPLGI